MAKLKKSPVSERALKARIQRKLAPNLKSLKSCRPDSKWHNELGDYYLMDLDRNTIIRKRVGLESLAKELDVIADHEELVAE